MNELTRYSVKIDQLPEEDVYALSAVEAARKVRDILNTRHSLRGLYSDEPVQLKMPDGRPWGRNLSLLDYKTDLIETDDPDGPILQPTVDGP